MPVGLKRFLTHPLMRGVDIDSPENAQRVSALIQQKRFLRKIYEDWYKMIAEALQVAAEGPILELGAGSGFLDQFIPDLIKSEILTVPNIDVVLDGQRLPFSKDSLQGIVMVDVLHHLPNVKKFFGQASDCVVKGGRIIMIEPWVTSWSQFVYRNLHHEPFDTGIKQWDFPPGGPLSQANSALPWIVFNRDRSVFENKFPEWEIAGIHLHTPFMYILSGGVSLKSFFPGSFYKLFKSLEIILTPWMGRLAMFAAIHLLKR